MAEWVDTPGCSVLEFKYFKILIVPSLENCFVLTIRCNHLNVYYRVYTGAEINTVKSEGLKSLRNLLEDELLELDKFEGLE